MKRGEKVLKLSEEIVSHLKPYSKKIMITGSIRRGEKNPGDIDIVLIPKDREKLEEAMKKKFRKILGGEKRATFRKDDIDIELYYTVADEWGACLLAYSSPKGSEIGLRIVARKKGFKLNQHGLFRGSKRVAGKTEREIYKALGRPYKKPEDR